MSKSTTYPSKNGQQKHHRQRLVRETETFLGRRLTGLPDLDSRHGGTRTVDLCTVPHRLMAANAPGKRSESARTTVRRNTLVHVPADEHGYLSEALLDRWGLYLSRLLEMPHRGNVMLDLAEVVSVPPRFLQVYEWFRRHLSNQGRRVLLQTEGACLDNPEPAELWSFVSVKESCGV